MPPSMKETRNRRFRSSHLAHSRKNPGLWYWYTWVGGLASSMEIIKAIGMAEMSKRKRRVFVEQSEKAIVVEMEQSGLPGLLILS